MDSRQHELHEGQVLVVLLPPSVRAVVGQHPTDDLVFHRFEFVLCRHLTPPSSVWLLTLPEVLFDNVREGLCLTDIHGISAFRRRCLNPRLSLFWYRIEVSANKRLYRCHSVFSGVEIADVLNFGTMTAVPNSPRTVVINSQADGFIAGTAIIIFHSAVDAANGFSKPFDYRSQLPGSHLSNLSVY